MTQELDMLRFWPTVLQVIPTNNYGIYAYFNDGSVRFYDAKHLVKPGTVFEPLEDIDLFKTRIAIINGTVAWDFEGNRSKSECIDLDPIVLFEQPIVADPLEEGNCDKSEFLTRTYYLAITNDK